MKILSKVLGLVFALSLLLVPTEVSASTVTNLILDLSDSRPSVNSIHSFTFTHTTAQTLNQIIFQYCRNPSGACTIPTNISTTGANENAISGGLTAASWTVTSPSNGTVNVDYMGAGLGEVENANSPMTIAIGNITNMQNGDCGGASNDSSETCYVLLTSENPTNATIDTGTVSYTIIEPVVVTARVDPTFTFTVAAVGANTVNNAITTSVASTYNTLPFGNLTASTPKYAAQALRVTTNTENGYTVTMTMLTQMTGVYTSNNIDPFAPTLGGFGWGAPAAWTEPTGSTPNDNTGWIGANTTDTDVAGWSSSPAEKFGPVSNAENTIMSGADSDNGTTPVYVTYAIEANVFQPADSYTGTLIYNALPTY
jgi:hypothetical protein